MHFRFRSVKFDLNFSNSIRGDTILFLMEITEKNITITWGLGMKLSIFNVFVTMVLRHFKYRVGVWRGLGLGLELGRVIVGVGARVRVQV